MTPFLVFPITVIPIKRIAKMQFERKKTMRESWIKQTNKQTDNKINATVRWGKCDRPHKVGIIKYRMKEERKKADNITPRTTRC